MTIRTKKRRTVVTMIETCFSGYACPLLRSLVLYIFVACARLRDRQSPYSIPAVPSNEDNERCHDNSKS
jgi:hypothetical protein